LSAVDKICINYPLLPFENFAKKKNSDYVKPKKNYVANKNVSK
jgi:hypothetical protein